MKDNDHGLNTNGSGISQSYAMVLLIKELMSQLDEVCQLKKQGHPGKLSMEVFKEMGSVLRDLEPELLEKYFELLPILSSTESLVRPSYISPEHVELVKAAKERFIKSIRRQLAA